MLWIKLYHTFQGRNSPLSHPAKSEIHALISMLYS